MSVPEHILYMVNSTPAMSRGHGMRWLPLTKVTRHVASWEGVTSERSVVIRVHPWGEVFFGLRYLRSSATKAPPVG